MMNENVLIGGEESGGISFLGHIPEGDGVLMGLLLLEIIAESKTTLYSLVEDLLQEVGPAFYERTDIRLKHPVAKDLMVKKLTQEAPSAIGGQTMKEISTLDGVKYILADDSWLLIRPSGTEAVLRVYGEGRSQEMVKELLDYGNQFAAGIVK
jgi:phosphomannomutase